ncbi:E3 ubiquitin-protein ligase RNF183 [Xenopus laevis]|uniref:E3 ubiquitin-protein ligase RNF183 n=2 Tax=Xenopus laevis TaxID=8355 RepID=A0A1L8F5Q1_XENLA|nr:E3 ubiquitin-protein ligase RNF183 [Xenopus laevis]OCT66907.1 hypothetical protein XELAEV_18038189mg [Xenopus laevis]
MPGSRDGLFQHLWERGIVLWGHVDQSTREGIMADTVKLDPDCDCPVCWNPYTPTFRTPKLLHCNHCFCMECLERLSQASQIHNRIPCPLCRHITVLPEEHGVTDLPTNTSILSQVKAEQLPPPPFFAFKDSLKLPLFQRPPSIYTVSVGEESGSSFESQSPLTTIPSNRPLWHCFQNPQLRMFSYLMLLIIGVTLFLILSIFWTRKFIWGQR